MFSGRRDENVTSVPAECIGCCDSSGAHTLVWGHADLMESLCGTFMLNWPAHPVLMWKLLAGTFQVRLPFAICDSSLSRQ